MATASSFPSEDQFSCSICLEVFSEPVSVPCGHNFCKACITRHLECRAQCPLCNDKFDKELKLRVNTVFRDVVENFKHLQAKTNSDSPIEPGQVPCDCCLGNKFKACKTCLVCLTSYCKMHLEPHLKVAALRRHKLTNPVHNLEEKICKRHNRIYELFCRNDQTPVCALCTDHSTHDTVPLKEEYVDKKAQLRGKKVEVQVVKGKRGKKTQKRKGKDVATENSAGANQMQAPHIWWPPTEDPNQFNRYFHVPEKTGCSEGRVCYDVHMAGGTSWYLGIVTESNRGKRTFRSNPSNGNWIVRVNHHHNVPVHRRILVLVDYDNGLIFFYDAYTLVLLCSFIGCKFSEKIFLFCHPSPPEPFSLVQKLQQKVREIFTDPRDIIIFFILVVAFMIAIWLNLNIRPTDSTQKGQELKLLKSESR